jgi:1,2-diacylglycerol 3-alpha-glucosyltransferase
MIVTIVADVFGTANNGTTIAALNLIRTLTQKGHSVRVLCPDKDKKSQKGFYVVPTLNFGPFQPIVDHNGVVLAKPDKMTIVRALKDVDEVHIMMPFPLGRATVKVAKRLGIPVSAGFHVQAENVTAHFFNLINNKAINHLVYVEFYRHFYRYVDAIHYPTQFIRDEFERQTHHKTAGYVISNGVSSDFHSFPVERDPELKGKFVILCTGRFSKEKRQTILIKAMTYSRHKDEIQLVFAGEGPRLQQMQRCAKRYGVSPLFRFFDRSQLVKMINMSDLYVHTSQIEIEAISCLEALSCGVVPVINDSPKSATRYFALGKDNLFKLNSSKDLAERIDYWFEHPEERKKQSQDYLHYCDQFNFDRCMDRMEKMIIDVSQLRKKPVDSTIGEPKK